MSAFGNGDITLEKHLLHNIILANMVLTFFSAGTVTHGSYTYLSPMCDVLWMSLYGRTHGRQIHGRKPR